MRTVSNLEISVFVSRIRLKGGLAGMLVQSTRILGKYLAYWLKPLERQNYFPFKSRARQSYGSRIASNKCMIKTADGGYSFSDADDVMACPSLSAGQI